MNKTDFNQNDSAEYEFTLDPSGGELVAMPKDYSSTVVRRGGGKSYFQPSQIGSITRKTFVTVAYGVNSTYNTLTVTVNPPPPVA